MSEIADLRAAWAGQVQWRVLQTCFGDGLEFLKIWRAWRSDPQRPRLLHCLACDARPVSAAGLAGLTATDPVLMALKTQLQAQWQGLLPGFHRLVFDEGRVLLTLGVGSVKAVLKEQLFEADSVSLGVNPAQQTDDSKNSVDLHTLHTLRAVARCCRRGTLLTSGRKDLAFQDGLRQCGFEIFSAGPQDAGPALLQARFNPAWTPKQAPDRLNLQAHSAARCVVVGAGLAGAACAASLARRGWQVTLLDAQATAAGGASSLPAGLLAPHVSPDDSVLSQLSRSGLRATWQAAAQWLDGRDWQASGVLQRRFDDSGGLPPGWPMAGTPWSRLAQPDECAAAQLGERRKADPAHASEPETPASLWHGAGGWIKPAQLTQALLATSGITQRYGVQVASLIPAGMGLGSVSRPGGLPPCWQVLDVHGQCLAEAELVVLAAGFETAGMLAHVQSNQAQPAVTRCAEAGKSAAWHAAPQLPLQAVRGQVAWGRTPIGAHLPSFPVNGHGSFVPAFTAENLPASPTAEVSEAASCWLMGATFERDVAHPGIQHQDHHALLARLQKLLPHTAELLEKEFHEGRARAWAGVRCATPDHLPVVGELDATRWPGLCVCTALGSRGLTFAVLCGELLAAWLHAEPLPLEKRLAHAVRASRFL